jgi:hypothetical protein
VLAAFERVGVDSAFVFLFALYSLPTVRMVTPATTWIGAASGS